MKQMIELREMLCDELENVADEGQITTGNLEIIDKLTHSIKSIDTIMAMEESGYSGRGYSRNGSYGRSYGKGYEDDYSRGNSYARGRGRYARRDSMGRYSRNERMMDEEM